MKTIAGIIAVHPFSKGLASHHQAWLSECAALEKFEPSQTLFSEGTQADRFFLVHAGHLVLQTFAPGQGGATIQTLGAGDTLGWSWLYPPHQWHFGAVAVEPVETVTLSARALRERMDANQDFGYAIAYRIGQVLLERLQATRLRLLEIYDAPV